MRCDRRAIHAVLLLATLVVLSGCWPKVRGQPLAKHVLPARGADFVPDDPSDAVLHYYGVGGWGILWRGEYLLTAPYFSNHALLPSSVLEASPNRAAIAEGFANTPYDRTKVILVGHGHVDHAADIPAYPFAGTPGPPAVKMPEQPTLIADQSTVNLLGNDVRERVCEIALPTKDHGSAIPTGGECRTGSFRITPLPWAHAPHLKLVAYLTFGPPEGTQPTPLDQPPLTGSEWLVGRTWAYLIELLDGDSPVFRILYVDSAANLDFVAPWPEIGAANAPIDVHIACVPNFDLVDGYPTTLLKRYPVKHVLAGHWESFFHSRQAPLGPVIGLSDGEMTTFVGEVGNTIGASGKGPTNKEHCEVGKDCGPHEATWTVPIPGETFRFRTGASAEPASR